MLHKLFENEHCDTRIANKLDELPRKKVSSTLIQKHSYSGLLRRASEIMSKAKKIEVLSRTVTVYQHRKEDFISLTDIARHRDAKRGDYIIQNWMRARNTIEFLGI